MQQAEERTAPRLSAPRQNEAAAAGARRGGGRGRSRRPPSAGGRRGAGARSWEHSPPRRACGWRDGGYYLCATSSEFLFRITSATSSEFLFRITSATSSEFLFRITSATSSGFLFRMTSATSSRRKRATPTLQGRRGRRKLRRRRPVCADRRWPGRRTRRSAHSSERERVARRWAPRPRRSAAGSGLASSTSAKLAATSERHEACCRILPGSARPADPGHGGCPALHGRSSVREHASRH